MKVDVPDSVRTHPLYEGSLIQTAVNNFHPEKRVKLLAQTKVQRLRTCGDATSAEKSFARALADRLEALANELSSDTDPAMQALVADLAAAVLFLRNPEPEVAAPAVPAEVREAPTAEDYDAIMEEAGARLRDASRGVQGQTMQPWHSLDWHVMQATWWRALARLDAAAGGEARDG